MGKITFPSVNEIGIHISVRRKMTKLTKQDAFELGRDVLWFQQDDLCLALAYLKEEFLNPKYFFFSRQQLRSRKTTPLDKSK